MARLIDADALFTLFVKMKSFGELTAKKAIRCVEEAPTVDAEPVRHGCWKPARVVDDSFWVCSSCGFPSEASGANILYKYCPVCGAKMNGEEKENE